MDKAELSYIFRDTDGKIISAARTNLNGNFPETISPSMSLRVDSGPVDVLGTPTRVDIQAYRAVD